MHEMFDLIGLPVTSIGLLNHVFDVRTKSSSRRKCQVSTRSVMKVATKWCKRRSRPKTGGTLDKYQSSYSHEQNKTKKCAVVVSEQNNTMKSVSSWSNGKNWHFPQSSDGDWVLVYPQLLPANNRIRFSRSAGNMHRIFNTDEVRQVVSSVVSFLKIAKEVFECHSNATPDHLSAHMNIYLKSNAKIWVPPL